MARLPTLLLLAVLATAAEPLEESGPAHAAVAHALQALSQGDRRPLLALPAAAFADPPGMPDRTRGVTVPWTALLAPLAAADAALAPIRARLPAAAADPAPPSPPGVPGWPQALGSAPPPAPAPWRRSPRHLLRLAGDAVVWQVPLAAGAQVFAGERGALIADEAGLRYLDAAGRAIALPPLPGGAGILGVADDQACFAQDRRAWRLAPAAGTAAASIELPGEALAAPLGGGGASLWLTAQHLVLWTADGTVHRHRHGLPAGRGWRLVRAADGVPLVAAPDGRAWAVPPWRPGDDDERLGLADGAGAAAAWRAALRRGDWPRARELAADGRARALTAFYAGDAVPPEAAQLAPVPEDPAELTLPEMAWLAAAAPRVRRAAPPAAPAGRDRARPLHEQAEPWPEAVPERRDRDGLHRGLRSWHVHDDGERVEVQCREDGTLRWFARWLPEPGLAAPGRSLALSGERLLVGEGDARLRILDAGSGTLLHDLRPRRLPVLPDRTQPLPDGAVVLHPPGGDDRLGWLTAQGERAERLAAPARWVLALPDGEVWTALADGRVFAAAAPGRWQELHLPAALAQAQAPRLVEGGIAAGAQRWRWRTP